MGGPILKNRLFFFADYQNQRFDIPNSSSANTVFTADERKGNFGAICKGGLILPETASEKANCITRAHSSSCTPSSPLRYS